MTPLRTPEKICHRNVSDNGAPDARVRVNLPTVVSRSYFPTVPIPFGRNVRNNAIFSPKKRAPAKEPTSRARARSSFSIPLSPRTCCSPRRTRAFFNGRLWFSRVPCPVNSILSPGTVVVTLFAPLFALSFPSRVSRPILFSRYARIFLSRCAFFFFFRSILREPPPSPHRRHLRSPTRRALHVVV